VAVAAEAAIRAWINSRADLVGEGNPLSGGAYLLQQRSPEGVTYAVISRQSEGVTNVVAEDGAVGSARIQCLVFAGTQDVAEAAGKALRAEFETLTGCPEACGDTGVRVLVSDNWLGPFAIAPPPDSGEIYAYQVNADFLLTEF